MFDGATSTDYYTTESLGTSQSMTPDGFLLCRDVPVARTGVMLYGEGEVPIQADANHLIRIQRDEADVFHPATLASFQGKPVVDEHPDVKVTPDTWRDHAVGVVLNPRRGDGARLDNQFTYCDLLITDKDAIAAVRGGKRQVSVGYDASYEELGPGLGRQHNIIVNHVALVDRGRCGPRCTIGDKAMANRLHLFRDRIRRAVRTRDEAGVLNAVAALGKDPELLGEVLSGDEELSPESFKPEGSEGGHHVTINVHGGRAEQQDDTPTPPPEAGGGGAPPAPEGGGGGMEEVMQRLDQLEQVVAMIAERLEGGGEEEPNYEPQEEAPTEASPPPNENDGMAHDHARRQTSRRAMVGDSTSLRAPFQMMLSQAEMIMPGIGLMTYDSAKPAKHTFNDMCSFKRKTLEAAKGNADRVDIIKKVMGDALPKTFTDNATMTCDKIGMVFTAAAALAAEANRGRAVQPLYGNDGRVNGFSAAPKSAADINADNAKYYATQH